MGNRNSNGRNSLAYVIFAAAVLVFVYGIIQWNVKFSDHQAEQVRFQNWEEGAAESQPDTHGQFHPSGMDWSGERAENEIKLRDSRLRSEFAPYFFGGCATIGALLFIVGFGRIKNNDRLDEHESQENKAAKVSLESDLNSD